MAAQSDAYGLSGYSVHGNDPSVLKGKRRALVQALQTVKALVDLDMGVKRIHKRAQAGADAMIIGPIGVNLDRYDERLNLYETDIALSDVTDPPPRVVVGSSFFDGRVNVMSSLLGYVVPDSVRHMSDWKRRFRCQGFLLYDTLISNAKTNNAPHYGTAVAKGGAMGGTHHVVPESVGAGEYLVYDIGPYEPHARAEWSREFHTNTTDWIRGSEKPVLRPFNPYKLYDTLGDALEDYLDPENSGKIQASGAASRFNLDPSLVDPSLATAAAMERFVTSAAFVGIAMLRKAGVIQVIRALPLAPGQSVTAEFSEGERDDNQFVASRLGLVGNDADELLLGQIMGAFYQPLLNIDSIATQVSISGALPRRDDAMRIQEEGSMRGIQMVADALWENVADICIKQTNPSTQHGFHEGVIC